VGDFNGDGKQDLAVANGISDNMSILISDCIEVRTLSQITRAETTCSQFSSRTAETLGSVQYDRSNGLIHRVNPRNFLYWGYGHGASWEQHLYDYPDDHDWELQYLLHSHCEWQQCV
jgi:hypothetical protein